MLKKPAENPDLIGHKTAETQFLDSWNSGRLPHAWLIGGPEGSGKATLAFRIARFVLSQKIKNLEGQEKKKLFREENLAKSLHIGPKDPIFPRVASGGHSDLKILKRSINSDRSKTKNSISVEDVRLCGTFLRLTSTGNGFRVLIIDSVDELTINAANALLKILEEPANGVLILIVCHNPYLLLPTIRSRCCQLNLKPINSEQIKSFLSSSLPSLNLSDIDALTMLSEGRLGRALRIYEEDGLLLLKELIILLSHFPKISIPDLHVFAEKLSRNGAENSFKLTMSLFSSWLSHLIKGTFYQSDTPIQVFQEELGCGERIIQATGVEFLINLWDRVNSVSEKTIRQNLDRKHAFLAMFETLGGSTFD